MLGCLRTVMVRSLTMNALGTVAAAVTQQASAELERRTGAVLAAVHAVNSAAARGSSRRC
jgi:hypothetical protein